MEILTGTSMYGVNMQNHLKRNGEVKDKVIKVSHRRKLQRWFSDGQVTGEVGFRRRIKGKGHTDLLVDANRPFQLNTFTPQKWFKLSVIMVSGMKKEFLSLFEIDELTVASQRSCCV